MADRKLNPNLTVLVDADIVAFQVSAVTQKEINFNSDFDDEPEKEDDRFISTDVEGAWRSFEKSVASIARRVGAAKIVLCLTCPKGNWRKDVLSTYKGNRKKVERPLVLEEVRARATAEYNTYIRDYLEADDILGILQTNRNAMPGETIIASIDKDLLTIPGKHYNFLTDKFKTQSPEEAMLFFLSQVLTGDVVDGFKGCPGVGKVGAAKILSPWAYEVSKDNLGIRLDDVKAAWAEGIVPAYEKAKLTEEDALVQAQVARICHSENYDFKQKKVKLWTP